MIPLNQQIPTEPTPELTEPTEPIPCRPYSYTDDPTEPTSPTEPTVPDLSIIQQVYSSSSTLDVDSIYDLQQCSRQRIDEFYFHTFNFL